MEKQVKHAFGKDVYLLGKDEHGINYWLEAGSWDCDRYWGLGYVETYTNNKNPGLAKDIDSHQHFDGLFFKAYSNGYDVFNHFFKETTLTDRETWELLELMRTLYTCREYSDTLYRGGSHYTEIAEESIIKNNAEYNRLNQVVIPNLLEQVYRLLGKE